jgi:S-formylglutathione hydrolase FrmB
MHRLLNRISSIVLFLSITSTLQAQQFKVIYTSAIATAPFTGKVFLYLCKEEKEPRKASVGTPNLALYCISVKNIKAGEEILFDDGAIAYPVSLSDLERGEYYVQAVWDNNEGGRSIGNSPGNMFCKTVKCKLTKNTREFFTLTCTETVPVQSFTDTKFCKELVVPSPLLTAFFKKSSELRCAVVLPKNYEEEPGRKFPVLYNVSGFGGDYHRYSSHEQPSEPIDTTACIRVILDGRCSLGHSVYANSANNGPVGDALVQEVIPAIEKAYHCNGARLLTGHSSGGWTVLWLQAQYPKIFTACWSSSPDPVDFRSFQKVNIYEDKNMYYTKDSSLRSVATIAGFIPWISMKTYYGSEHVLWRGEQMHSFDAVFSERSADGIPRPICDPLTGVIDPVTADTWKKYDISLQVRTNWEKLKGDLQGKVRVSVGNNDNFLLNPAVHLMEAEMKKLDAGFIFQYYPGDHFTVHNPDYMNTGYRFLEEKYNAYLVGSKEGKGK